LEECLEPENRRPPNDNLTLIIVDLQAYFADATRTRMHSPSFFSQNLQLRMMNSDAGQTENQEYHSQQSNSERMVPYKLLNFEKL
jgi:hypothetical protein